MQTDICLKFKQQHEEQRQLTRRLRDVAAGIIKMKPRKTPVIDTQVVAQAFEQQLVSISFALQFSPEPMIHHPVHVLATVEKAKYFTQKRQLVQVQRGGHVHGLLSAAVAGCVSAWGKWMTRTVFSLCAPAVSAGVTSHSLRSISA